MAEDQAFEVARRSNKWRIVGWGFAGGLVTLPLIAMQFSSEVQWTGSDFLFAILMLGSVGLGLELAAARGNRAFAVASGIALLVSFLSIWFTTAVGIIGNESEDSNLLFVGVIAIALAGSAIARFRAGGMAVAMMVAALAQLAIAPVATLIGDSRIDAIWAREVVVLTIVFTALWLVAAHLFRRASREAQR